MARKQKLKNLSSTVVVVLGILSGFGREGAYLDEVCEQYQAMGLDVNKPSVRVYLHRVSGLGFLKRMPDRSTGLTIYTITKAGKEELKWWRSVVNMGE